MKKVCVITSTRAEYGLLSSVIRQINDDSRLQLLLIATGMHLDVNYGETYKEIEADGFNIHYKISINSDDSEIGILNTIANGIEKIGKILVSERPDMLVLLGDRYELLAFASAAVVLKIPIAHISGGEITEGAFDEYIRHAITKLSMLHFVSTEEYRNRVIQMGENPKRVFNVGDLGVFNVNNLVKFSKEEVERRIEMHIGKYLVQVTFHPETLSNNSIEQFSELLKALEENINLQIVFTKANADLNGKVINSMIDDFVKKNSDRAKAFYSLGYKMFLSLLSYSFAIIGNSSSGIVEAPSLRIGTINIGDRQKGRTRAKSTIDCEGKKEEILKSIDKLKSKEFQDELRNLNSPYESDDTARKIVCQMRDYLYNNNHISKSFFDL